jgi:hypothetical protein
MNTAKRCTMNCSTASWDTRTKADLMLDCEDCITYTIPDPLDMPLPCDIKIGNGTMCKGTPLRTLVLRMTLLHSIARAKNSAVVINSLEELQVERYELQQQLAMALATIERMATQ